MPQSPLDVTLFVTRIFEELDISYAIGGSVASATHGTTRATMDVDIVADLDPRRVDKLIEKLGAEFYADETMIRDAVARRASFNLLHLEAMFKVDIFVSKARPFDTAQLQRRQRLQIGDTAGESAYVTSAEDIILAKLEWYRKGHQVSDRQWRDVLGVMNVQQDRLDWAYLQDMARKLGVEDLLTKARDQ